MNDYDSQDDIVTIKIPREAQINIAAKSIIGTRDYQQDAYFVSETEVAKLAVVCDGMGGMEHGERASQKAVEKLVGDFEDWDGTDVPGFLMEEARQMDRLVYSLQDERGKRLDAGTTVVAVIVVDNRMYWLSVGDSRIYVLRGNEMQCVTRDHNYGYKMEKKLVNGEISEEEFLEAQDKFEALVSYIGMGIPEMIDVPRKPFELMYDDRILLCSDGLYKCLKKETIEGILFNSYESVDISVENLIQAVEESPKKHKDNTTVIMMSYE